MILSTLDILYITLSLFVAVIGTLLAVVLYKVVKILGVVEEITSYYYTLKRGLKAYEQIPTIVLEKIQEFAKGMTQKKEKKKSSV